MKRKIGLDRFNYTEFVDIVRTTVGCHPLVSNFYTERYRLNTTDDIEYPAIVMTTTNIKVGEAVTDINFNLMYVDRLTEARDNTMEIYTVGIDAVTEIYNALRNRFDVDSKTELDFNLFYEQFADNVAGTFTAVSITMPSNIGTCDWLTLGKDCGGC